MRILNVPDLISHGNVQGRKAALEILEAGLEASDPYNNTQQLIRVEGKRLSLGNKQFEPTGTPMPGEIVFDLDEIEKIYVIGAGKGIQRVAQAIEDCLGERLTGGHVIDKKGYSVTLKRIGVTLGGHPIPDEDCVEGCRRILEITRSLTPKDLVITCVGNGVSSLLTMPVPGVSLEDIRRTAYIMQIEKGAPTPDLTAIRNHLDMLKGGKISKRIFPAKAIHILALDAGQYSKLINNNSWLHTLPDHTTFQTAVNALKKYDALEAVPAPVRRFLEEADPEYETVKPQEFEQMASKIFGVMPGYNQTAKFPAAIKKASELGFQPIILTDELLFVEASQAGIFLSSISRTIERTGLPFTPPCALFTSGEGIVTVGKESGVGGRNQELTLSAALRIAGSQRIVIGSVDTDGTDGPGDQFIKGSDNIPCLAGGIVDGETLAEARKADIDISQVLKRHNSTPALMKLKSGILATPNISLNDLTIALIM